MKVDNKKNAKEAKINMVSLPQRTAVPYVQHMSL